MNIHFFDRKIDPSRISIEKVFNVIKKQLIVLNYNVTSYENPYALSRMVKSLFYFKRNQGEINHITGDIHWACLLLDKNKTILTIHDLVGVQNYKSPLKKKIYLFFWLYLPMWRLKYITVISQKTKNEILEYYPSAKSKITIIPNPLTIEFYDRKNTENARTDFTILVVGTRENKNLNRILQAVQDIACNLIIVGAVSPEQNFLISQLKAKVVVKSFVSDTTLQHLYRTSDILCFPSLYEGFGMPILEAQASGCVVLTSNIEPMITVAGNAGILVDPYSVTDIKEKLRLVLNDNKFREDLILKGYVNAKKYLPEVIAEKYLNIYKEVLGKINI